MASAAEKGATRGQLPRPKRRVVVLRPMRRHVEGSRREFGKAMVG